MIRILIFLLSVAFLAAAATVLAGIDGRIEATAFGRKYDIHTGFAVGALIGLVAFAVLATGLVKDLARVPGAARRSGAEAKRARGLEALARGLEAVSVGDAKVASVQARIAERDLQPSAVTRLLCAQAAEIGGDEARASEHFTAMLAAPETEFLGLRGLYLQAMGAGDADAARRHAERAFSLRPKAAWAFESVLALGLGRGAWGETREALRIGAKNGIVEAERARRGKAALLAADAYAAAAAGDDALALADAEHALKLAPGLAPAATLAARLQSAAGRGGRAAKTLEQAFAASPHPALVDAHVGLFEAAPASKRAEQLARMAATAPAAREAKVALARRFLILGEHRDAVAALEPLLIDRATARECALMAQAVAGAYGEAGEGAARAWLQRAAGAPRDPAPGSGGSFQLTREGWAQLVREYMEHGRLAPPPLEEAPPGVSAEDIRRLAPPAPVAEAAPISAPAPPPSSPAPSAAATPSAFDRLPREARDLGRAAAAAGEVS